MRTPDWGYWNAMKTASVMECVFLSLDVEPIYYELAKKEIAGTPKEVLAAKRVLIANNHLHATLSKRDQPLFSDDVRDDSANSTISISQFVAWARSLEWDMPERMTGYIEMAPPLPTLATEAVSALATPLKERERNALLRIAGALLDKLKKTPGFKSEAELIRTLDAEYDGYDGLSKANLEKVFSKAKQLLR